MRQSSLVGERVEGMRDGIGTTWFLMCYNYRRREEAPYTDMTKTRQNTRQRYIRRQPQLGRPVSDEFLTILDVIHDHHRHRWDDPRSRENSMEWDMLQADWLVAKVRGSDVYAQNLYAAMCNREFIQNDVWAQLRGEPRWRCSWRSAGGIISDMRKEGDYMDWYCSGMRHEDGSEQDQYVGEGTVTDEIRADLLRLGWTVLDEDE